MIESRSGAAATVVSGKIFCCGGVSRNSAECYDPSSDVWTLICNMPRISAGCSAAAIGKKLILIGGHTGQKDLNNILMLDTTNSRAKWIEKSPMSRRRSYFSTVQIDNKIFVCGGDSEDETIDDVEMFDGEVWNNFTKLRTPVWNAPAVVVPTVFVKYLE